MKSVDLNTKLRSIATALERIIRSDYPAAARYNQLVADVNIHRHLTFPRGFFIYTVIVYHSLA